jgi:fatty-acyl-CoA synthase
VVVECRPTSASAQQTLRQAVRATVQRAASVECEVILAAPGSLTFTTSGKLSRAAAKARYLGGEIRDVAAAPSERTDQCSEMQVYAVAS